MGAAATVSVVHVPSRTVTVLRRLGMLALLLGGSLWLADLAIAAFGSLQWELPAATAAADGGHAFQLPVPDPPAWGRIHTDGDGDGLRSDLRLAEDGRPLGPSHASHDTVRSAGHGAYSHWNEGVWFSSSDGTDPRTNGRRYTATAPLRLTASWRTAMHLLLVTALAAGLCVQSSWLARILPNFALGLGTAMLATIVFLHWQPLRIVQPLPTAAVRPHVDLAAPPPTTPRWLFELFVSQVRWRIPPLFVACWPRNSRESHLVTLEVDGEQAHAVPGLPELEAAPRTRPTFTVHEGQNLLVQRAAEGPHGEWRLGLHVVPSMGALLLAVLMLATGLWLRRWRPALAGRPGPVTLVCLAALAAAPTAALLTAANVFGALTAPLRAPFDASVQATGFGDLDRPLCWTAARPQLARRADESDGDYLRRLTAVAADTVGHAWDRRFCRELRMHVPLTENWFLWACGELDPADREYFFVDPRRSLERGIGLCGHVAHALAMLLREAGLDARVVQLGGHTVVTAAVGDAWWIADPDVGLVIPAAMAELEASPHLVEAAYAAALQRLGRRTAAAEAAATAAMYASRDNFIGPAGQDPSVDASHYRREDLAYALKWPAPLLLLAAGLFVCWWLHSVRGAAGRPVRTLGFDGQRP